MILPQKEIVYKSLRASRQKIPVTGRNFLTQDKSCCHRNKFALTAKKLPVTGKHFLSQEVISCHSNKFPVTGKVHCDTRCSFLFLSKEINFLSQEILFISQEKILL